MPSHEIDIEPVLAVVLRVINRRKKRKDSHAARIGLNNAAASDSDPSTWTTPMAVPIESSRMLQP